MLNINKFLVDQLKDRKHNYIRWATQQGIKDEPNVKKQIDNYNNLIRSLGGDPSDE